MSQKIRVMLVDDSAVVRGLLDRALREDPSIDIVASASNGEIALTMLKKTPVDIIVLDIEMPVMDGITALPQLLAAAPGARVIMASTLTKRNADISIRALELGASDYICKPTSREVQETKEFYTGLITKIRALAPKGIKVAPAEAAPMAKAQGSSQLYEPILAPATPVRQSEQASSAAALAIASSTGGPQALLSVFREFRGKALRTPIFITQHMPPNFTTILAEHISKASGMPCHEAIQGEPVVGGTIYLAPGDFHMTVERTNGELRLKLDQNPPENFCRPSADPMLRSLAKVYGDKLLVAVLTGLGADGARGSVEVVARGGKVIAQDEATCVVYGMPKAVAEAKLTSAVFPLNRIAPYLLQAVT